MRFKELLFVAGVLVPSISGAQSAPLNCQLSDPKNGVGLIRYDGSQNTLEFRGENSVFGNFSGLIGVHTSRAIDQTKDFSSGRREDILVHFPNTAESSGSIRFFKALNPVGEVIPAEFILGIRAPDRTDFHDLALQCCWNRTPVLNQDEFACQ